MQRFLFLTSFCLAAVCARAQDSARFYTGFGVELYAQLGFSYFDFHGLNHRLEADGKTAAGGSATQVGFGVAYRFSQLVVGTEFSLLDGLGGDESFGGEYGFYVSTNVLHTRHWIFSPIVGANVQYIRVDIPQATTATTFDDALGSANALRLYQTNSALDLGLSVKNTSWIPWKAYSPLLRIGYRVGLARDAWNVANATVTGAPSDRVGSFYVALCFGYGI